MSRAAGFEVRGVVKGIDPSLSAWAVVNEGGSALGKEREVFGNVC